ncbi:MlaE family ABC transporter permease [Coraliomargarita akajimensis]|uniref:STAS domain-containing protein n=1 Tax=Coraliomargarita akajimensis (strain DSM 45221 / IAM 15411 / JCM 23193 / KCTC 12865 / 04OKA010-24) TaxID=583355 RepID=D5EIN3_CORAD|nr:ABC transporter permease [Coraliomargarita akajimensis]ADE54282.1 protein of unknown function DUF140 [Coraliomargarita akajimensis DSM 45221]
MDSSQGLCVRIYGDWLLGNTRPGSQELESALSVVTTSEQAIRFDAGDLGEWDTGLLIFIRRCYDLAQERGLEVDFSGLPEGAQNMMALSLAVPEPAKADGRKVSWLSRVGERSLAVGGGVRSYCDFFGQFLLDLLAFVTGRGQVRRRDFFLLCQETGVQALPIVMLLNCLTGLIIAFIGVIQLQKFAADIFVADLVGLATARELGAVITGVIMAGRTGAAFAAQIGSMQVNEEVDALTTFGISPMQFLVVPRVVALVLMMPLLGVVADIVGILGGLIIAVSISDVSVIQYFNQVHQAVGLNDFFIGIFKCAVFGLIIGIAGCYRGLNCGRDASSVGLATTSAVVTSITWLVVADAIFAVLCHLLGI